MSEPLSTFDILQTIIHVKQAFDVFGKLSFVFT